MSQSTDVFEYEYEHPDASVGIITLEVAATFRGFFYPAKMYPIDDASPAEYPDLDVAVTLDGIPFDVPKDTDACMRIKAWARWHSNN